MLRALWIISLIDDVQTLLSTRWLAFTDLAVCQLIVMEDLYTKIFMDREGRNAHSQVFTREKVREIESIMMIISSEGRPLYRNGGIISK